MTSTSLPIDARSAAAARDLLRRTLGRCGPASGGPAGAETAQNAALALTELVANAVRHAHDLLILEISVDGRTLHVAVVDDASGSPTRGTPDTDAVSGRGVQIVDAVADRWGVVAGPGRKTVWFEMTLG